MAWSSKWLLSTKFKHEVSQICLPDLIATPVRGEHQKLWAIRNIICLNPLVSSFILLGQSPELYTLHCTNCVNKIRRWCPAHHGDSHFPATSRSDILHCVSVRMSTLTCKARYGDEKCICIEGTNSCPDSERIISAPIVRTTPAYYLVLDRILS
jgi:hypothetical protein